MLESVAAEIVAALREKGVNACHAYPREPLERDRSLVCVAVKSAAQSDGGFAGYLGVRTDENGGRTEVYGMRCELSLALDIYAPMESENGALECLKCFDAVTAALGSLRSGLKIQALQWGEASPDRASGMFRCRCGVKCAAFLSAEADESGDKAEFSDFILKGELKK